MIDEDTAIIQLMQNNIQNANDDGTLVYARINILLEQKHKVFSFLVSTFCSYASAYLYSGGFHYRYAYKKDRFIKKYLLVPDETCMMNVSRHFRKEALINTLINNGGKVTMKCIKQCAEEYCKNRVLNRLINEMK